MKDKNNDKLHLYNPFPNPKVAWSEMTMIVTTENGYNCSEGTVHWSCSAREVFEMWSSRQADRRWAGGDLYRRVCEGMFGEAQKAVNTLTSDTASKRRNSGGKEKKRDEMSRMHRRCDLFFSFRGSCATLLPSLTSPRAYSRTPSPPSPVPRLYSFPLVLINAILIAC